MISTDCQRNIGLPDYSATEATELNFGRIVISFRRDVSGRNCLASEVSYVHLKFIVIYLLILITCEHDAYNACVRYMNMRVIITSIIIKWT